MSLPARSCRMNVAPPDTPTPWMAGGGKAKPMAPLIPASRFESSALMAPYCSSGFLRLDHSSKVTKKNALYVFCTWLSML
ncbi:MAG: hypothetical protein BWX79_03360 [Alphaproteobacteria bacterium ADurb.Bin100]|nr:MAG: hypothetical protein BWX79_03360 [Alphaproteobacteria bacterium ADurb.Bin100]